MSRPPITSSGSPNGVASDGLAALLRLAKSTVDGVAIAGGIAGGLVWITDTAMQFKTNREAWNDFSDYTSSLLDDIRLLIDESLVAGQENISSDISKLQAPLIKIVSEMQQMKKRSFVSKFLQAQEDPKKIAIFRQMLTDASLKFNTTQLVAIRTKLESMTLNNKDTKNSTTERHLANYKPCPSPSHLFTGRQDILECISSYFKIEGLEQKQRVFVLCGLGGSGKSQLAFKFVQLSQIGPKRFSEVFMIDATTTDTIEADLQNLALANGLEKSYEAALQWLSAQPREWLLLFDNADDVGLNLRKYFPACSHGNILITTRNQAARLHGSGHASHFIVAEMTSVDAEGLLLHILGSSSLESQDELHTLVAILAKELSYFALALVQVGSYIVTSECGISRYLELFKQKRGKLIEEGSIDAQKLDSYQHSAYTTWRISFEKLSPDAIQFLQLCSFLHHDGITERMFMTATFNAKKFKWIPQPILCIIGDLFTGDDSEWDVFKFLNMISQIRSYSLMNYDVGRQTYSVHPLVHVWIRNQPPPISTVITRDVALFLLALCIDFKGDGSIEDREDTYDRAFEASLMPHADDALEREPTLCAEVSERLAAMYHELEMNEQAFNLISEAFEIRKRQHGEEHLDTLTSKCLLAEEYRGIHKLAEAESLACEGLTCTKRVLGPNHRLAFEYEIILARVYRTQTTASTRTVDFIRSTLDNCEVALGLYDRTTLRATQTLAMAFFDLEQHSAAQALLLAAIDVSNRLNGPDHEKTCSLKMILARSYCFGRKYDEGVKICLELIQHWSQRLGPYHVKASLAKDTLAYAYMSQQRYKEAELLMIEFVETEKALHGLKHPRTVSGMGNLAEIYIKQGIKLEEAELLCLTVLELDVRPIDHVVKQMRMSNLARVYHLQGRKQEAIDIMERAHSNFMVKLGPEHSWSVEARNDLEKWRGELAVEGGSIKTQGCDRETVSE